MKAVAIDDEPIALDVIRSHAEKVPFLDLKAEFTNAFKAADYLQREPVDLIFLDIKMPDISGIDFYNSLSKKPMVIFTTAYTEHAVTSFELDAIDYLLKPFSLARFLKSCNKAFELYNFRNGAEVNDYIFVKTGFEQVKVLFDDILYLEAGGNYITFVTSEKNILSRMTLGEAIELLPADRFKRVHRSYIASSDKITRIERHQISIGGNTIPLSESYAQELESILKK